MDHNHSTLELAKHDETARAPERDYDATAFELDASASAPQAVPDTTPQVFYNTSFPETHGNNEESTKELAPSLHITKPTLKWSWMAGALVIAAAIAIGIGVGIWRQREHSSHKSSTTISSPAPLILNDTSLAALSLANGDRQLFFQDNTGLIRRAVRSESNNQWSTSPYLNASTNRYLHSNSNPKNHTPLAVATSDESRTVLYYVSQSHVLSSSLLDPSGGWTLDSTLENHSTAVDTRSLSITLIGNGSFETNPITNSALLLYENPSGNVSALLQRISRQSTQWLDITNQESQSLPDEFRNLPSALYWSRTLYESNSNVTYGTPFACFTTSVSKNTSMEAVFYSPSSASLEPTLYDINLSGPGNFSSGFNTNQGEIQDYSSISQSDIAYVAPYGYPFALWINDNRPVLVHGNEDESAALPDNTFPFARLASVTLADQSTTFLYHQINGTMFAEEQWDNSMKAWLPSVYITVSDS